MWPLLKTLGSVADPCTVMPERRNVFGFATLKLSRLDVLLPFFGTSSRITDWSMPAPISEMPFVTSSSVVQLHVPAGIITVSPTAAAETALPTSVRLQDAADLVAA